ncbi:MAG: orotidine-5'-phosphate decarboxylase [Planctomycetota bacterium]|nr:orotidine-5'-phosphate decarboxylase [Planctomycetota bacterium]
MTERPSFADRLIKTIEEKETAAVVGLDPRLDWIPASIRSQSIQLHGRTVRAAAEAIWLYCLDLIDLVEPYVAAVKAQIAFFEPFGGEGLKVYARVVRYAQERGLIVIGDVKRSDIASTAEAYARAHLGEADQTPDVGSDGEAVFHPASPLEVDAVTINPYLGSDGVRPFLDRCRAMGKGVFILCRTSNPSAADFQDQKVKPEKGKSIPLHEMVARSIVAWGDEFRGGRGYSSVGAVVGLAKDPELLGRIRAALPDTIILVPGYGAQGGREEDLIPLFQRDGLGVLVNSSRGVGFAFRDSGDENWGEAVENAARDLRDRVNRAREAALKKG